MANTLFSALRRAQHHYGNKRPIAEDLERTPISYDDLTKRSAVLGQFIGRLYPDEPTMGVLLPNALAGAITFFALQAIGRTPAMLNFTAGIAGVKSACTIAQLRTIITARKFIAAAQLEGLIEGLEAAGLRIAYLEDMRTQISLADKLCGVARLHMPQRKAADTPAVILFTSGSEGMPKGVVLSHANLLANLRQITTRLAFTQQDVMFSCLPIFHSFGLTAGLLLPLLHGMRVFFYPSPLHYKTIPELIHDTGATLLFGADTFLNGYAQCALPHHFQSVRAIYAGAEKLKDTTRRHYGEIFGVTVYQGYGVTETAPVLAVNTAEDHKPGTVGQFLPEIEWRISPVDGIAEGGQLWVKGPNVMAGYLRAEAPGQLQPPHDGWHDTGDIVSVDGEGFITIQGRAKRFAKIGGEMVSLAMVESCVGELWPDHKHAAITLPDPRKGEQIVLLTENPNATIPAVRAHFKTAGLPELYTPRALQIVDAIPLLGSGKVDYIGAKALFSS